MKIKNSSLICSMFCVLIIFLSTVSNADDVFIQSNQSNLSKYFNNCGNIKVGCTVELEQAIKIINSGGFQKELHPDKSNQLLVSFSPNIYRIKNSINILWNSNVKLIFQGNIKNNKQTVINGSIETFLKPLDENDHNFSRFPEKIRGHIYIARLPVFEHGQITGFKHSIVPTAGELFWNNQIMNFARWPNQDFTKISSVNTQNNTFTLNGFNQRIRDPQLQAHGFWHWDWADQTYRIEQDLKNKNSFKILSNPTSDYGIKANQRVYLENGLELLDQAGEWYQDYTTGIVYFWLPDKQKKEIEFSVSKNLLTINNSRNIEVKNIVFEKNRADAILVTNSKFINFKNIRVNYVGNTGIRFNAGNNNIVDSSKIENTGSGGVFVNSGDRENLVPANIIIKNSYFSNNDRLIFSYQPAIKLLGVGQIVKNNIIENSGHAAILFQGNNHLIINNKIRNVLKITSDAGAIYTGRDLTSRGTVIENNILSNIVPFRGDGSVVGVYLDDQASGITVKNNKFLNVQYGIQIGGGRNNVIQNNIFERNKFSIRYDARGLTWQKIDINDSKNEIIKNINAVPIHSQVWRNAYPDLSNLFNDNFGKPKYNIIKGNKFIKSGEIHFESGLDISNDKGAVISSNLEIR